MIKIETTIDSKKLISQIKPKSPSVNPTTQNKINSTKSLLPQGIEVMQR